MIINTPSSEKIDSEQHVLFENAQRRIRQKKRCYNHTALFLIGSVFLFITNKVFHYGPDSDWYLWAVLSWGVILTYHWVQVFIMNRFLGPEWERTQREKLVQIQRERIENLKIAVEESTAKDSTDLSDTSK
jgi:hypothetical protein